MTDIEPLELELREEIRRRLEEGMVRRGFKTQKEAAKDLGIDPARLNQYLKNKSTPSAYFLLTVCKSWNLKVHYNGVEFGTRNLPEKQRLMRKTPEQLPLFSALKELDNQNLGVRIEKKSLDKLELSVQIRFAG